MLTPWGETLDVRNVLSEYPRPQMRRDSCLNLNGYWDYAFCKRSDGDTFPEKYEGQILVPFSPEAELSGVRRSLDGESCLWYRRRCALPEGFFRGRLLLHFGAVDSRCQVWCNRVPVGAHRGGYYPFAVDLTDAAGTNPFEIMVRVEDDTDTGYDARGKQKTKRGGIWYTPQSGIWQTVWLESVPDAYIDSLRITPDLDAGTAHLTVVSASALPCTVQWRGGIICGMTNADITLPADGIASWTPETPVLHPFSVIMQGDRVDSYLAMRKYSVGTDQHGTPRLMLNNRPYYHNGVLDQGYWPDGLYTAPSDAAMIYDIETMKSCGFNMLRKHIKIEPLRWYYHCDRLGMLVWQDAVNGGGAYRTDVVTLPVMLPLKRRDDSYRAFGRGTEESRACYLDELKQTVQTLYNCPSIAMWVPFNEGWGQFDANRITALLRTMDATRTVDQASGWYDQGGGDVKSRHVYFRRYRCRSDASGRAVVLSECGGYHLRVEGHCFGEHVFGYRKAADAHGFLSLLHALYQKQLRPAIRKGLSACVYTQVSDVEDELNGFLTYDRKTLKLTPQQIRSVTQHDPI